MRRLVALGTSVLLVGALHTSAAQAAPSLPDGLVEPGRVVGWGGPPDLEKVLEPPEINDAVAIAASDAPGSYSSLALRADGTVVGWGLNRYAEASPPADLKDVVGIDTGAGFSLALRSDGSVASWGSNESGQLDVPADLGPVTAVSAGGYFGYRGFGVPEAVCGFALALRPDGTVVRWGGDREGLGCDQIDGRLDPPAELTDVVAISAGPRQALALKSDGTVAAWGPGVPAGFDGTPPTAWSDVVAISAGSSHNVGLRADGTVLAYGIWGESGPPDLRDVTAISASQPDLLLRRDTTISSYPDSQPGQPTGPGFRAVSAGDGYGLAIGEPEPELLGPPLGSAEVQPFVDTNPSGTAEAFQYTATRSAPVTTFHLYLDATNEAKTVVVGVYADEAGEPGRLLGEGRSRTLSAEWNAIGISGVILEAGERYWLAILAPKRSELIRFRDRPDKSGGPARVSTQTRLTVKRGLPGQWHTGSEYANSPASAYLD